MSSTDVPTRSKLFVPMDIVHTPGFTPPPNTSGATHPIDSHGNPNVIAAKANLDANASKEADKQLRWRRQELVSKGGLEHLQVEPESPNGGDSVLISVPSVPTPKIHIGERNPSASMLPPKPPTTPPQASPKQNVGQRLRYSMPAADIPRKDAPAPRSVASYIDVVPASSSASDPAIAETLATVRASLRDLQARSAAESASVAKLHSQSQVHASVCASLQQQHEAQQLWVHRVEHGNTALGQRLDQLHELLQTVDARIAAMDASYGERFVLLERSVAHQATQAGEAGAAIARLERDVAALTREREATASMSHAIAALQSECGTERRTVSALQESVQAMGALWKAPLRCHFCMGCVPAAQGEHVGSSLDDAGPHSPRTAGRLSQRSGSQQVQRARAARPPSPSQEHAGRPISAAGRARGSAASTPCTSTRSARHRVFTFGMQPRADHPAETRTAPAASSGAFGDGGDKLGLWMSSVAAVTTGTAADTDAPAAPAASTAASTAEAAADAHAHAEALHPAFAPLAPLVAARPVVHCLECELPHCAECTPAAHAHASTGRPAQPSHAFAASAALGGDTLGDQPTAGAGDACTQFRVPMPATALRRAGSLPEGEAVPAAGSASLPSHVLFPYWCALPPYPHSWAAELWQHVHALARQHHARLEAVQRHRLELLKTGLEGWASQLDLKVAALARQLRPVVATHERMSARHAALLEGLRGLHKQVVGVRQFELSVAGTVAAQLQELAASLHISSARDKQAPLTKTCLTCSQTLRPQASQTATRAAADTIAGVSSRLAAHQAHIAQLDAEDDFPSTASGSGTGMPSPAPTPGRGLGLGVGVAMGMVPRERSGTAGANLFMDFPSASPSEPGHVAHSRVTSAHVIRERPNSTVSDFSGSFRGRVGVRGVGEGNTPRNIASHTDLLGALGVQNSSNKSPPS